MVYALTGCYVRGFHSMNLLVAFVDSAIYFQIAFFKLRGQTF